MKHKCEKCSYVWEARVPNPKSCPRCKQYMNKPKQGKKEKGK